MLQKNIEKNTLINIGVSSGYANFLEESLKSRQVEKIDEYSITLLLR